MEGFYGEMSWARELLTKEKKEAFLDYEVFFGRGKNSKVFFSSCRVPLLWDWGMERACLAEYLIGVYQKIPGYLIKILFLERLKSNRVRC